MTITGADKILTEDILPMLPAVAVKILSLESETEVATLARIASQDPSLSARILRAANSPLYAPMAPIGHIKRAVILLGERQVRSLSLAFSLIPLQCAQLDFARFWEHSLVTAVATRRILTITNPKHAEEGFTAGLLANLGAILLAGAHPREYLGILQGCRDTDFALTNAERAAFGFDHVELGAAAARRWNFPESFQAIIAHHHNLREFDGPENVKSFVHAAYLAGMLADFFHSEQTDKSLVALSKALEHTPGLAGASLDDLSEGIEDEIRKAAAWLGIRIAIETPLAEILEAANRRLVALTVEYEQTVQWFYRTYVDRIRPSRSKENDS
ncbi:HDOD domain-containing protein [Geoalkalibacter halelectricus]|uniref:HDOD domain-containing protein n=1 Tax=Geoalkalibacter halelectricus TaxID=2847045 RepID=A0ABY5ZN76_9BACT|nr:HDOD domain-containing protein [Geoalkalibacter halelectricus]MDO3377208.1 HDOD domain-containing protein [Geoalkalibacter halelectricus]UWZ79340.1 HDOD domain-containing protein [Geoalkalibacter halelectricus]